MHFASISFHCWFFVPLPVFCSSSPLKKSLVLCSSSPPPVTSQVTNLVARCRRVYRHAHDYHINSISNNRCLICPKQAYNAEGSSFLISSAHL
uniref:Secreted protein n=1 Tax=Gossypium raimondii TaxID=29730 RepID=A0A0D2RSI5_GOSRA|nr:hypothetical protein B456_011G243600 [Gossypium raimondii]